MRARAVAIARASAMACAVTCAVTAVQAVTLTATYVTAPEARGPRRGVVVVERADADAAKTGDADARGASSSVKAVKTMSAVKGMMRRTSARWMGRDARREDEGGAARTRRRVVAFVTGDSTACGVGCESAYDGETDGAARRFLGPTLARTFAASVSESLRADVEWRALGFKGADVRGLRDKLIPALREAMRGDSEDGSMTSGTTPDAVVIMCGINDAKHSVVGRTSANFRSELSELVKEVRAVVGDECVVVLPATPIEVATLFPPPLAWVATRMNDLWDEQKAHVSALTKNVVFVTKPSLDSLRQSASKATGRVADTITLICGDGIHPNDVGYDAWARHIADACVPSLRRALAEGESP